MSLSPSDKLALASSFILQSPPGEVNDVLSDLRLVLADDAALEHGVASALEGYNTAQLIGVDVPGEGYKMILSEKGKVLSEEEVRYLDPRAGKSYIVDQVNLTASSPLPHPTPTTLEPFRLSLQKALDAHLQRHFAPQPKPGSADPPLGDASCAVFPPPQPVPSPAVAEEEEGDQPMSPPPQQPAEEGDGVWTLQVVSSRYKPTNYWSGRWRATWEVDLARGELRGDMKVDVHYYEQGNVQLHTHHTPTIPLPSSLSAPSPQAAEPILQLIADAESAYHTSLTESFERMRDGGFRGLRRVLPVTRGKMDWDKVLGYKLGQELAGTGRATGVGA